MAFVHRQSCEGVKRDFDLFGVPPTQTGIVRSQWVEYQPTASLDSSGPIEFLLPAAGDDYLDLVNTYVIVKTKVTTAAATDLDPGAALGPVNN